jgi:hypothetical protein
MDNRAETSGGPIIRDSSPGEDAQFENASQIKHLAGSLQGPIETEQGDRRNTAAPK